MTTTCRAPEGKPPRTHGQELAASLGDRPTPEAIANTLRHLATDYPPASQPVSHAMAERPVLLTVLHHIGNGHPFPEGLAQAATQPPDLEQP